MIALRWLFDALSPDPCFDQDGGAACWFCGAPCMDGPPSTFPMVTIRDTFTNHDQARRPDSPWVCQVCTWYFDNAGAQAGKLLTTGWRVSPSGAERLTREGTRDLIETLIAVNGPLPEPVAIAIPTSLKKHLLPWTEPTSDGRAIRVRYEQQSVTLRREDWLGITAPFDALRRLGHSKQDILNDTLHPMTLRRHGQIATALTLSAQLAPWRGSAQLAVVAHVSPGGDQTGGAFDGHRDLGDRSGGVAVRLGGDQSGLQGKVPAGHLGSSAEPMHPARADDQRPGHVAQPSLFDV